MKYCRSFQEGHELPKTLEAIVDSYMANEAKIQEYYLSYYVTQPSLVAAISAAALAEIEGGGRFSHQNSIPHSALNEARKHLSKLSFDKVTSFTELHELIAKTIGSIHSIGVLTIYDTAHRLGAYLGLRPEFVYLHAGVRSGAKALGMNYKTAKLPVSALPKPFHQLRPEQAEDCLCIYKAALKRLKAP